MKKLLYLLFVLILTQNSFSQQGKGLSNAVDNEGYCYVTGYTPNLYGGNNILVTKYNLYGDTLWTSTFPGANNSGTDEGVGIKCTNDGYVYVVGNTANQNTGYDIVILKYNTSGSLIWSRFCDPEINTPQDDKAFGIAVDDADNVFITGYRSGAANGTLFTAKYFSNNSLAWANFYNGYVINSQGSAIVLDHSGNVYVTGFVTTPTQGTNIITVKYNAASGTSPWAKTYNGTANSEDKAFGIAVDNYDNIYVTGYVSNDPNSSNTDIVLMKYLPIGFRSWLKTYNNGGDDKAFGLVTDGLTALYITGYTTSTIGARNYVTLKYDLLFGSKLWENVYDGTGGDDVANSIGLVTVNGVTTGVVVTGSSLGADSTKDYATVMYSTGGTPIDSSRYTGTLSNDVATELAVTTDGTIYVTGGSDLLVNQRVISTIKTQKLNWASKLKYGMNNSVPVNYTLYQNYPNPFNPSTNIKFDLVKSSIVKLTIYDMLGKEIAVPINQFLLSGTHEISYSNSSMASGTYFYELKAGDFRDVKKMILIK